jgi:hypothetical protein
MMPAALIYALADDDQRDALNCLHAARGVARDQTVRQGRSRSRVGRRPSRPEATS